MKTDHIAKVSVDIKAPAAEVWDALTNPAMIKQYLFGTDAKSDWKEGSSLEFTGEHEGKTYHDKGTILKVVPEKLLQHTYLSSMSGKEDKPENYATVTYELAPKGDTTTLTLRQDNNETEASKEHSEKNWTMVLDGMKKLLESKNH